MESSDVFERTEEWARTIRDALDAPRLPAEASADEPGQAPGLAPDDQVHTPSRSRIQPPTPADTPVLTPSRTRIVLKADSVAESAGTAETIQTIPTLATLESTFEATLHARAMRAAGADLDAPTTPAKAVKAPRAAFALYGGIYDDYDDESRRRRMTAGARRDSMKLREALVRGQEGTRQRRRWENDHLMHVPNAQLPLPSDWQVHPTHPVHHNLPYHVAQYWDRGLCKYVNETRAAAAVLRRNQIIAQQAGLAVDRAFSNQKAKGKDKPRMPRGPESVISMATSEAGSEFSTFHVPASTVGLVTRQLRAAAKRTPAVKLWVRAIEVPIRQYVVSESMRLSDQSDLGRSVDGQSDNGVAIHAGDDEEFAVESDSEDEVVFIGRRILQQKTESWKRCPTVGGAGKAVSAQAKAADDDDDDDAASDTTIAPTAEGILFDDLGEGERGSFKRWLAHSLSDYYGLTSTSSTVDSPGKPGNRVVYMALREDATQPDAGPILIPRPMWELFDL